MLKLQEEVCFLVLLVVREIDSMMIDVGIAKKDVRCRS